MYLFGPDTIPPNWTADSGEPLDPEAAQLIFGMLADNDLPTDLGLISCYTFVEDSDMPEGEVLYRVHLADSTLAWLWERREKRPHPGRASANSRRVLRELIDLRCRELIAGLHR